MAEPARSSSTFGQSGPSAEKARGYLAQMKIEYSEDSFLNQVVEGNLVAVQLFLVAGMGVELKDTSGATALTFAALKGHLPVVEALLAKGANVNAKDINGETALMWAIANNRQIEVVNVLRRAGAR